MPWELFMGNASHRLISYMYDVKHPANRTFHNKETVSQILEQSRLGDVGRLHADERRLCPDISDVTIRKIFEVKPCNKRGLEEGLRKVQIYLTALNRAMQPGRGFSGGAGFQGEILVKFAQGSYIWRLEWRTTALGVIQYSWTRSREPFDAAVAAHEAAQWVEISEQELKQYGGWVAQAVEGMVDRRERLTSISEAVGVAIHMMGSVAVLLISAAQPSHGSSGSSGGKVLPFPKRPLPAEAPARLPAASGM